MMVSLFTTNNVVWDAVIFKKSEMVGKNFIGKRTLSQIRIYIKILINSTYFLFIINIEYVYQYV